MSRIQRESFMRVLVIASVVVAAACGAKDAPPPAKRTAEEQRAVDSTVGASRLPGAGGVQGALRVSDSAAARARALDSLSRMP
jgi:hypothetical protein